MAGQMGNVKSTMQCLEVIRIDVERQLLLVKGAVPGSKNSDVVVRPSVKAGA
jgi:large subunit ribosomal protein L3